ncbi:MAG: hypothetical protein LC793_06535 [Thermomicrobia bacterium]|nr:hypothetical protein [Thermomicrobia bacterium]
MPLGKKRLPSPRQQGASVGFTDPRHMVGVWQLWSHGDVLQRVSGIEPLLASWNRKTDPAQIRLQRYLDDLQSAAGTLPSGQRLFLHMQIDVKKPERLLHHYDLENYLTPVVIRFGAGHFVFVSATKSVGRGSHLMIGHAVSLGNDSALEGWSDFAYHAGSGAATKEWKVGIRNALLNTRPQALPPGPVAVHLAWRCARQRNWAMLWKPTGDAMGPVLGEPSPQHPFNPSDDRIVSLGLHLNADDAMGHDVDVGMWWRRL